MATWNMPSSSLPRMFFSRASSFFVNQSSAQTSALQWVLQWLSFLKAAHRQLFHHFIFWSLNTIWVIFCLRSPSKRIQAPRERTPVYRSLLHPRLWKWAWHRQALKKGLLNKAIWSESSLNRSPGIRTERISGADKDSSFQVCASQPSVPSSSSSYIPDPQPPHSPAPRPSPRSRGAGRLLSPSGRNSNSRNSWPNLPLCPT